LTLKVTDNQYGRLS